MERRRVVVLLIWTVAWSFGAAARSGPLTPPGAPAPSMKTLDQVEARIPVGPLTTPGDAGAVYVIAQPGSYYLTGNIIGETGKDGVRIQSSNVTLDLNGFSIVGGAGTLTGVVISNYRTGVAVRNGTVTGWSGNGVSGGIDGGVISDLMISVCAGWGVNVSGSYATLIERVTVYGCGGAAGAGGGIATSEGVVRQCTVRTCTGNGISAGSSIVTECYVLSVSTEGGFEGTGIFAGIVESSRVGGAGGVGIWAATLVRGCVSVANGGANYQAPNVVDSY